MVAPTDFIQVGKSQVSLQCMVSLADVSQLREMAERMGRMANVQMLVDLLAAVQQGEQADFIKAGQARADLQYLVSLSDLWTLKEMADRLGGMACLKVLLDLLAGTGAARPAAATDPARRGVVPAAARA